MLGVIGLAWCSYSILHATVYVYVYACHTQRTPHTHSHTHSLSHTHAHTHTHTLTHTLILHHLQSITVHLAGEANEELKVWPFITDFNYI